MMDKELYQKISDMFDLMNDLLNDEKCKLYNTYWAEFSEYYRAFNRHRLSMLEEVKRMEKLLEEEWETKIDPIQKERIKQRIEQRKKEELSEQLDRILKLKGDID